MKNCLRAITAAMVQVLGVAFLLLLAIVLTGCTTSAALKDDDARVIMAAGGQTAGVAAMIQGQAGYCKVVDTEGTAAVTIIYHPDGTCTVKATTTEQ